jgi:hypothetical protein
MFRGWGKILGPAACLLVCPNAIQKKRRKKNETTHMIKGLGFQQLTNRCKAHFLLFCFLLLCKWCLEAKWCFFFRGLLLF